MPRQVMFASSAVFLSLLLMCCCSGFVFYAAGAEVESVLLFKGTSEDSMKVMDHFRVPSLAQVGDILFAFGSLARFVFMFKERAVYNVTMKYIEKGGDKWEVTNLSEWRMGNPGESFGDGDRDALQYPATVVKDNKIYIIAFGYGWRKGPVVEVVDYNNWDVYLLVCEVQNSGSGSGEIINWEEAVSLKDDLMKQLSVASKSELPLRGGPGIITSGGSMAFPVMIDENKTHSYPALIHSPDGNKDHWKISKGKTTVNCFDPSIVELEAGKLLMMASCDGNRRKVFESSDVGETWTEASATLSRVWYNVNRTRSYESRTGMIAATLDGDKNEKVMLLTVPRYSASNKSIGRLHLWMSDAQNRHIYDAGSVTAGEDAASSALLYTKSHELFSLHEYHSPTGTTFDGLLLGDLTGSLGQMKSVLQTWEEVDRMVRTGCISSNKPSSSDRPCSAPMPTSGLVGILSGNYVGSSSEWKDEYLCVDAIVTGGNPEVNRDGSGLTFKGSGSWAEWPVSKEGLIQRYHFANYNFALMATVTIHSQPAAGSIPLIGVRMNDGTDTKILVGLSYRKDKEWEVTFNADVKQLTVQRKKWDLNKEYHVMLELKDGNEVSVYIDGERVSAEGTTVERKDGSISHFYIGGDDQGGTGRANDNGKHVSVANVLLYNRPFTDEEIQTLKSELGNKGDDSACQRPIDSCCRFSLFCLDWGSCAESPDANVRLS